MKGKKQCDWTTYSHLAAVFVKAGLHEKAESALKRLEEEMEPRNRLAYRYLISLYAGISKLGEVHRIWNSLKSAFPTTDNLSYIVMLQALAKLNDVDSHKRCFEEWELSCSSYDIRLVKVAIRAYLQNDMKKEAESVLHEAFKRSKEPPFRVWEMFMVFLFKQHQVDFAMKCMESAVSAFKDDEWHPDPNAVYKFLKYFVEAQDVDGAEATCKMLKKINRLDSRAYHSLLLTYIAAGKTASEMQRKMEEDLIEMNCELEDLLKRVYQE
ncbi:pentatricopeptide repeat-containing protein At1g02370, mitochondrial-like [Actinidia eriantha]|uniref:pentatricopeptide repeat-containing protein At1g02370, mitochondrial-like n=1 Tax=Actinidia eriantha TaxID=165200 RepID=UPI00258A3D98|nr:pentatricopeptide repeat-containing protein At1g02370, mitochondrial-like [Actinidia eriantha]